jgi:hypothetical protein
MQLRKSKILKILAIILFSFELLAPSIFAFTPENDFELDRTGRSTLSQAHLSSGLSALLLFEELGEEEIEDKSDIPLDLTFFYSSYLFDSHILKNGLSLSLAKTKQIANIHPPLFVLYRVFLI